VTTDHYIDVDSKLPPTLWAQPPDVSGAIPHTNNGVEAYHSHLSERWILRETSKHDVDVLKKVQQTAYVAMNSASQPARIAKNERERRVCCCCMLWLLHILTRQQYLRKVCHRYGPCGYSRAFSV